MRPTTPITAAELARVVVSVAMTTPDAPANDNAGDAWARADAAPHVDDHRHAIHVEHRAIPRLADEVSRAIAGRWIVASRAPSSPAWLAIYPASPASRRVNRLVSVVRETIRAAARLA